MQRRDEGKRIFNEEQLFTQGYETLLSCVYEKKERAKIFFLNKEELHTCEAFEIAGIFTERDVNVIEEIKFEVEEFKVPEIFTDFVAFRA